MKGTTSSQLCFPGKQKLLVQCPVCTTLFAQLDQLLWATRSADKTKQQEISSVQSSTDPIYLCTYMYGPWLVLSLPSHAVPPPGLSLPARALFDSQLGRSVGVVSGGSPHHGWSHLLLLEAQSLTETAIPYNGRRSLTTYVSFGKIFFQKSDNWELV